MYTVKIWNLISCAILLSSFSASQNFKCKINTEGIILTLIEYFR